MLGKIYFQELNMPEEAIHYFTLAKQVEPSNLDNLSNFAVVYLSLRRFDESINLLNQILREDPRYVAAWKNLGFCYERIGRFDSARVAYQQAIRTDPLSNDAREYLASLYLAAGEADSAAGLLREGVRLDARDYRLRYSYGVALSVKGERRTAEQQWLIGFGLAKRDSELNPGNSQPSVFCALFKARLTQKDLALESLHHALAVDSSSSDVLIGTARVYGVLGMKTETVEWFTLAKKASPIEFDEVYVQTSMDLMRYGQDPDLLGIARQ